MREGGDGVDEAALREFCERTVDDVYRYARRLTGGDQALTADLVQETYLSLMRHMRDRPEEVVGLPWLVTACRHRFVDELRRSGRRERLQFLAWSPTSSSELPPLGVVEALARLPATQRAAVVMSHVDQMTVSEIAVSLGRSVHATESILRRGRAAFRLVYLSDRAKETEHGT